jgi:uncharacterized metal-binding protein
MAEKCLCETKDVAIFSCAGSANVGQIANQAALQLAQKGLGRYLCLAGIGGHVSGMIESTKACKMIVAIDGCPVACATKTLEHAGFHVDENVQVAGLGIEKNHEFNLNPADVNRVTERVAIAIRNARKD